MSDSETTGMIVSPPYAGPSSPDYRVFFFTMEDTGHVQYLNAYDKDGNLCFRRYMKLIIDLTTYEPVRKPLPGDGSRFAVDTYYPVAKQLLEGAEKVFPMSEEDVELVEELERMAAILAKDEEALKKTGLAVKSTHHLSASHSRLHQLQGDILRALAAKHFPGRAAEVVEYHDGKVTINAVI